MSTHHATKGHVHILGIAGTFMGGLALIAREAGFQVSGADQGVYPPMSDMLRAQQIDFRENFDPAQLDAPADWYVVGNALSRGVPLVETLLNRGLPYSSGPQWLAEQVLRDKWVLAVSGTHGKTTTASMLAWILDYAGMQPGFLIGGVPANFGYSARLGGSDFFVIEADEYDSAFFDKRSKFVHFRPRTLIVNNIEFDHADIFPDLAAIQRQFHHMIRTVPGEGRIVANTDWPAVTETLDMGCWTPVESLGSTDQDWRLTDTGDALRLGFGGQDWSLANLPAPGRHNAANMAAAIAAARHVGVTPEVSLAALAQFQGVKRRLELRGEVRGVRVLDDFAHHPTAIRETIDALRRQHSGRVLAVLEPRSNTMKMGVHKDALADSLHGADRWFALQAATLPWQVRDALAPLGSGVVVENEVKDLVTAIVSEAREGDTILVMSNGAFGGIHGLLLEALANG